MYLKALQSNLKISKEKPGMPWQNCLAFCRGRSFLCSTGASLETFVANKVVYLSSFGFSTGFR